MPALKPLSKTSQAVFVGLAILLLPHVSTALEWSAQPSVTVGSTVNDNINLVPGPHDTVWASTISPQVTLNASSARSTSSGRAQINRLDYFSNSALSRTDGLLDLTFTRQYERSQLSLAGNLTRDSTLESELIQTGVVTTRAQRTSRTLDPTWSYFITERDVINFGYSYLDVSYGNATTGGLLNYTEEDPSVVLTHAFSEKNKLNLSLSYSNYKSLNPVSLATNTSQYRFTTTSAQMGFSRELSETLSVSLMAGVHKTDSSIISQDCLFVFNICFPDPNLTETNSSNTGSLFKLTLQKAFESSQITSELSRSLQPTADGGEVQTDRLLGGYNAKLSQTVSGSLNMSLYKTQASTGSRTSNNSRYYSISPALSWQITEWWSANAFYARSVSKPEQGAEAAGNAINLTLNYNWPKISRSR